MATAIIKWVIQKAGTFLVNDLRKQLFGDASNDLQPLLQEVIQLEQTIITIELENRILPYADRITSWMKELDARLDSAKRGFTSELDDFIRDIANANDGVANALTSIDRGLTGNDGIADQGLLDNWHNAAYSRLADKGNVHYTVASYIQEMDSRLQTMLQLYRNGLILLTLTTQDAVRINEYCREWKEDMVKIMNIVYGLYPPAVKLLKPSYDDWTLGAWFRLQRRGTSQYLYHDSKGAVFCAGHSGSGTEWQFSPAVPNGLVGLISREGWRLKIESYSTSGLTGHTEDLKRGDDVVFKMIPLKDVPDAAVALVGPYSQSTLLKYDCSANKNVGVWVAFNDWVLQLV